MRSTEAIVTEMRVFRAMRGSCLVGAKHRVGAKGGLLRGSPLDDNCLGESGADRS